MTDTALAPAPPKKSPLPKVMTDGKRVVRLIGQGYPVIRACELVGVTRRAHYDWVRRGAAANDLVASGGTPDPAEYIYLEYYQQVQEAQIDRRATLADVIYLSAVGGEQIKETRTVQVIVNGNVEREESHETTKVLPRDWRAAAFYLKHRHPEDFHTRVDQTITSRMDGAESLAQALSGMDETSREIALRNLALVASLGEGEKADRSESNEIEGDYADVPEEVESVDEWLNE